MSDKTLNARIQMKTDTEANWSRATNFVPKIGEIIIYAIDSTHSYQRIKVGDGTKKVNDLPFINDVITNTEIDEICNAAIYDQSEVQV